jgi:hypothetical protein
LEVHLVIVFVFDAVVELQMLLDGQIFVEHVILQAEADVFTDFIDVVGVSSAHNLYVA